MRKNSVYDWEESRKRAMLFPGRLEHIKGYKYTINHDVEKYPAAMLYGTWSVTYLKHLLLGDGWIDESEKTFIMEILNRNRLENGLFFPLGLQATSYSKSKEYLSLHCYNYAVGAALIINADYDFQSRYMDFFLDADNLERWLNQRSLERPWEESNNIVNVASYLALYNDKGNSKGKERLYQMLEWHNSVQNKRTGGFENLSPSRKNILTSMAGAVHNFHIHHYLDEPMNYEEIIGQNVIQFLFEGPLTACLSIDFVELACYALPFMSEPHEVEQALLYHLNELLKYQNKDGGFYENESSKRPTTANGMKEETASSNSYATWFRMCSIGMIATTLFGDNTENWHFRKTLGMGYFKKKGDYHLRSKGIDKAVERKYFKKNLSSKVKAELIQYGAKLIG